LTNSSDRHGNEQKPSLPFPDQDCTIAAGPIHNLNASAFGNDGGHCTADHSLQLSSFCTSISTNQTRNIIRADISLGDDEGSTGAR
jgi:hypothetical protein